MNKPKPVHFVTQERAHYCLISGPIQKATQFRSIQLSSYTARERQSTYTVLGTSLHTVHLKNIHCHTVSYLRRWKKTVTHAKPKNNSPTAFPQILSVFPPFNKYLHLTCRITLLNFLTSAERNPHKLNKNIFFHSVSYMSNKALLQTYCRRDKIVEKDLLSVTSRK